MKTSLKVNTRPYIRCFFALGYGWKWPQKWPFVATKRAGSAGPGQSLHLHAKEDQHNFLVKKTTTQWRTPPYLLSEFPHCGKLKSYI